MRAKRVVCKLCGGRGSIRYKVEVQLQGRRLFLCLRCFRGIKASPDPGTRDLSRLGKDKTKPRDLSRLGEDITGGTHG